MSDAVVSLLSDAPAAAPVAPQEGSQPAVVSRPENIPETFWDSEKNSLKTDELLKSYDEAEKRSKGLRDKLAKGWQNVPEDPSEYGFELSPEVAETLKPEDFNEKMIDFAKLAALKAGMSKDQFNTFMADILPQLNEYGIAEQTREPTEAEIEAQEIAAKEASKAELEKLGEGADRIISSVKAHLNQIKNQKIFSEDEMHLIESGLGSSAEGVSILDKMFTKMFGANNTISSLDVKSSSFGVITEQEYGQRLRDPRNGHDPAFYAKTQEITAKYTDQKLRAQKTG